MRRPLGFILFALLLPPLPGCTVVPSMDGAANVSVNDVAKRVKCDIWKVVWAKLNEPPFDRHHNNRYAFLKGWGAKVHLTLAVDNTGSLNPGAMLIKPLPASQSFSLGLGAGATTEAVSTTDYEFLLSFAEMNGELRKDPSLAGYNGCFLREGLLLESDLRIDELFERALEPVEYGTLRVGHHPGVAGASAPPTPAGEIPDYDDFQALFAKLQKARPAGPSPLSPEALEKIKKSQSLNNLVPMEDHEIKDQHIIDENKKIALQLETLAQTYINNIVKPVTDILSASFPACVKTVTQLRNEAIIQAALVSNDKIDVDGAKTVEASSTAMTALNKKFDELERVVRKVVGELKICPQLPVPRTIPQAYDPLDLVSQTINFYITSSGSITPTWKLTRVTAPLASTFASVSRKDTNTLIIAFGRPDLSKEGGGNTAISNQILTGTLRDAIRSLPGAVQ
jgi:hypothetical protein